MWVIVNDTYYRLSNIAELQHDIEPATSIITSFSLPGGEAKVKVEVTTSRGNKFAAENNPIWISEGGWGWQPFSINVVMVADNGWIRRTVYVEYIGPNPSGSWNKTVEVTQLVVGGYASVSIGVNDVGYFKLMIWDNQFGYKSALIFSRTISVSFAMPSPWVYVPKYDPKGH